LIFGFKDPFAQIKVSVQFAGWPELAQTNWAAIGMFGKIRYLNHRMKGLFETDQLQPKAAIDGGPHRSAGGPHFVHG
jgi:hypothetical protein